MSAPTTYRRPVSRLWWAKKPTYFLFLMRELSCLSVAWAAVFLMMLVYAIGRGQASYLRFLDWASSPVVIVVNVVALAFLVLHTVTWFALTPQAMVVRAGGRQVVVTRMVNVAGRIMPAATVVRVGGRVPAAMVIASQYLGLAVVSAFIAWLVIR
jgi:fumarate reductase subunit C